MRVRSFATWSAFWTLASVACGTPFSNATPGDAGSDAALDAAPDATPHVEGGAGDTSTGNCAGITGLVDLNTNPAHCGACDHSCGGTPCTNGLCPVAALGAPLINPRELALDVNGGGAFITIAGKCDLVTLDCPAGTVIRADFAAPMSPMILAPSEDNPEGIVADDAFVYWSRNSSIGAIMRVKVGGSTLDTVASQSQEFPRALAIDSNFVYWATRLGGIYSATKSNPFTVAFWDDSPHEPSGIAVGPSGEIYWTDLHNEQAGTIPNDGSLRALSQRPNPYASSLGEPTGLAVDGDRVFWAELSSNKVMVGDPIGGAPATLVASHEHPFRVALDGNFVYFTARGTKADGTGDDGFVVRAPRAGGDPPLVLATGQVSPSAIAVDGQYVYWLNRGHFNVADGTLQRVAK